jgi:hypothetical protein
MKRIGQGDYDVFRRCDLTGRRDYLFSGKNIWLDTWGAIAARVLGLGDTDYVINAAYIEFENVDAPEDEVTVPEFDETSGLEYFANLSGSPNRDFLRIALDVEPSLFVVDGFEMPADHGNGALLYATTSGTTGVHGKEFSDAVNSKICGVAIVAAPVWADQTQDLIFARSYFEVADQALKQPNAQHTITYRLKFAREL